MRTTILLLMPIITLFFSGCNSGDKTKFDNNEKMLSNYNITTEKTFTVPIPDSSTYRSRYNQYYVDKNSNKKYLIRRNETVNAIEFINIAGKKLDFMVKFDKVGPNGIGKIRGFYVLNTDTIFVTALNRTKIYLSDTSAKIYYSFPVSNSRFEFGDFWCNSDNKIVLSNNKVYISTLPVAGIDRNPELFYNSSLSIAYDLILKQTFQLKINYPTVYFKNHYTNSGLIFFSRTFNKDKNELIFSFPADHNLYTYDILDHKVTKIKCKSIYIDNKQLLKEKNADYQKRRMIYLENPKYYLIIYDKYNTLYYRIILLPIEIEKNKKYSPYLHYEMPFSVMVLDGNLKIIMEKRFPKHKYNCSDFFVTEEGLWISNNNPYNPEFNEDLLSYSLFKLNEND